MFFQFSNFAQCHVCFSMFCDIFARFGARLLDRDLRIQQPFGLKKSQKSFSVVLNYWFLHRCIKLHLFFFIKLHLFGMNLGWIHIYSGHNGEDIVKIIRAVDSTTNPWLNLAAALLEALSRRRTSKYEPSYNCDKSERTKSIKKPKRQYDLRNFGKHVAHIAYSFPHLFALHALPHLQHMQVSFLATVKAPRDIYIFIGPETGIGYEAGKFSVVCFCMRRVRTFRAKHAKHGWIFDIFRRDPTWWVAKHASGLGTWLFPWSSQRRFGGSKGFGLGVAKVNIRKDYERAAISRWNLSMDQIQVWIWLV